MAKRKPKFPKPLRISHLTFHDRHDCIECFADAVDEGDTLLQMAETYEDDANAFEEGTAQYNALMTQAISRYHDANDVMLAALFFQPVEGNA